MKTLPRILACLIVCLLVVACRPRPSTPTAEAPWRKAAQEFLTKQNFAPIEIKPGTRFQSDLSRERFQWQQRVLLPIFEKHLEKWPAQAERARSFVKQVLQAAIKHPDVDRNRTPEMLEQEGLALGKVGVEEPLVLWATAWAAWEWHEGYTDAISRLQSAAQHRATKDYPAALQLMIRKKIYDIMQARDADEPAHSEECFKAGMQAAKDTTSYAPDDDEILWHDIRHVFYQKYVETHKGDMEKLAQMPGSTPWLQEMMQGSLHSTLGWKSRGSGFANTITAEGWRGFLEQMPIAAAHFRKAWELRPDRADAAVAMVDILKQSGFNEPGETTRLWFDRAVAAQFDATAAYYDYVWALRPRWGGSVDALRALLLACALTDRPDTEVAEVTLKLTDFVKRDSGAEDDRAVLQTPVLKEALLYTAERLAEEPTRVWEHPWRLADLGVYSWKAAEYSRADDILRQVPVPFPRQTRRNLNFAGNEIDVRGQSAIYALGLQQLWQQAEDAYAAQKVAQSLHICREIASRFSDETPAILRERIAACQFETAFASGGWVEMEASPDMAQWHHLSGPWAGAKDSTLQIAGQDAQAYLLHNGRVGRDFELRGDYTVEGNNLFQGLNIMVGYHRSKSESFIACSQWNNGSDGSIATLMRDFAQTTAPQIILRGNDPTWRFHIVCKNGRVSFRLNHNDVLIDHLAKNRKGEVFQMPENGLIGFCSHFLALGTKTRIRHLEIRRLPSEEAAPASNLAGLHQLMAWEVTQRLAEARRAGKTAEAEKIEAFGKAMQSAGGTEVPLPPVTLDENILHSLLRGYLQSVRQRLVLAGQPTASAPEEEPLEAGNRVKWETMSGDWKFQEGMLIGSGDSMISYDFNRAPPFQIDFDITVREGMRPHLMMGKVQFANEGFKTALGLYPRPKNAALFNYELNKTYQITIRALADKSEMLVNGAHVCDGPKIEGAVDVLQFCGGDKHSKGKTEFQKIRIRQLP